MNLQRGVLYAVSYRYGPDAPIIGPIPGRCLGWNLVGYAKHIAPLMVSFERPGLDDALLHLRPEEIVQATATPEQDGLDLFGEAAA